MKNKLILNKILLTGFILFPFFYSMCSCQTTKQPTKITYQYTTKYYWLKDTLHCEKKLDLSEKKVFYWKDCYWDNDTLIETNILPHTFIKFGDFIYLKYSYDNLMDSSLYYSLNKKDTIEILNIHDLTNGIYNKDRYSTFLGMQKIDTYDVYVFRIFEGKKLFIDGKIWATVQSDIYIEKEFLFPVKTETYIYKLTNQLKREDAFEIMKIKTIE
ncbi:MAG: hypothetical protein QY303_04685 [Vicingaceae bacterium]|nr:MAG: hypothetical protein QY303_04685 [Vicingaceae bacterium]